MRPLPESGSLEGVDSSLTGGYAMDGATTTTFRTPTRILIPKLVQSRAGWKTKAGQRKQRLQAARLRIRDLEHSRDNWKERAGAAESHVGELQKQLAQTQQDLAPAQGENAELKKKQRALS